MRPPKALRPRLWLLGTLATLGLVVWLVLTVLGSTTFTLDSATNSASSETTLGNARCRKTLQAEFPFVRLECRERALP